VELRSKHNLEAMAGQIRTIMAAVEELKRMSGGVPAIDKNADAILAFAHILESSVQVSLS
jgi:hypothetical protein